LSDSLEASNRDFLQGVEPTPIEGNRDVVAPQLPLSIDRRLLFDLHNGRGQIGSPRTDAIWRFGKFAQSEMSQLGKYVPGEELGLELGSPYFEIVSTGQPFGGVAAQGHPGPVGIDPGSLQDFGPMLRQPISGRRFAAERTVRSVPEAFVPVVGLEST
jgi:hypothetical protein